MCLYWAGVTIAWPILGLSGSRPEWSDENSSKVHLSGSPQQLWSWSNYLYVWSDGEANVGHGHGDD